MVCACSSRRSTTRGFTYWRRSWSSSRGIAFRVNRIDWLWLIVAVAAVWCAEAFNTAVEFLADEVSLECRGRIRRAKDLASAGVLIAATAAAVIGAIVFLPRVLA